VQEATLKYKEVNYMLLHSYTIFDQQ